jgi:predicted lipoprotein with Yx(FWY)xxD motif
MRQRTLIGVAALVATTAVAVAFAASSTPKLRSASNAALGHNIVVDSRGHSVYRLSPETTHHLLCTSQCLGFWIPVGASSAHSKVSVGHGVSGHVAVFKRSDTHRYQVTLNGWPLYTFVADKAAGQANGQGAHSFGGVWLTITAKSTTSSQPTQNTTTNSMPGY